MRDVVGDFDENQIYEICQCENISTIRDIMMGLYGDFMIINHTKNSIFIYTSSSFHGAYLNENLLFDDYQDIKKSKFDKSKLAHYISCSEQIRPHVLDTETNYIPPGSFVKIDSTKINIYSWMRRCATRYSISDIFKEIFDAYAQQYNDKKHIVIYSGGIDSTIILQNLNQRNLDVTAVHLPVQIQDTIFAEEFCKEHNIKFYKIEPDHVRSPLDEDFYWLGKSGLNPWDYYQRFLSDLGIETPIIWNGQNADSVYHVENRSVKSRVKYINSGITPANQPIESLSRKLNESCSNYVGKKNHISYDDWAELLSKSKNDFYNKYLDWISKLNISNAIEHARYFRYYRYMSNCTNRISLYQPDAIIAMPYNEFRLINYFLNEDNTNLLDAFIPKSRFYSHMKQELCVDYRKTRRKIMLSNYPYGYVEDLGDKLLPIGLKSIYSSFKHSSNFNFVNYGTNDIFTSDIKYLQKKIINNQTAEKIILDYLPHSRNLDQLVKTEYLDLSKNDHQILDKLNELRKLQLY
jgi:hypothetical protein